jgi:host factor-I protein
VGRTKEMNRMPDSGVQHSVSRPGQGTSGPVPEKREKMEKPPQNIQDGFLNTVRKEKLVVTVYLLSGVKLTGRIRSFDKYSLILESNNQEQLVFKHAVATVVLPRAGSAPPSAPSEG